MEVLRLAICSAGVAGFVAMGPPAYAGDASKTMSMPVEEQNALVQKQCGGCHTDVLMFGGLSVEHFDAAHPDPTVAAMLVSKLTSGRTPRDVERADQGPNASGAVRELLQGGALGANGKPLPDDATQVAFLRTLTAQAAGADTWHSNWTDAPASQPTTFTANILRQADSFDYAGLTDSYRLVLTCHTQTREGEIKVTWANGVPTEGQPFAVSVDGKPAFKQQAEGGQKQGNGNGGPGSAILYPNTGKNMRLPAKSLTVSDLFPAETVVFPFDGLSPQARENLSACFGSGENAH